MKLLNTSSLSPVSILEQINVARSKNEDVQGVVQPILDAVKLRADDALREFTERFDGVRLDTFRVSSEEIREAYAGVDEETLKALKEAKSTIECFHETTFSRKEPIVETRPGVQVWREFRPIERVGLYIPGGTASYPSTVLMTMVLAQLAGCREIVLCTPCNPEGRCNSAVLVAADLCGIASIYKVGGAQAIAAMAYGTETVPKVYKIFGPGNQYVSTAKMLVFGEVDIDKPAGPSEVAILADESARPDWVAADLLSQLEHGEDSQALLVTFSQSFAEEVRREMQFQMKMLSRQAIIEQSFARSFAVVVNSFEEACEILNEYAPEHLEIMVEERESEYLEAIVNVGSVFLGPYSSEPLGDYATGANHTLPTSGYAKMFSPLSTEAFGKMIQIQRVSQQGIEGLRNTVECLAACEGFDAHAKAVSIRF